MDPWPTIRPRSSRRSPSPGTVSEDGKSLTFKINPKAKFWDGTPVTAEDVKWSFSRAVSLGGFPAVQMKAGSMTEPEQFVAVDDMTFRIDLPEPSKLTLPDLAVPVPFIINSKVAKANATADDPWATEYLHTTAGRLRRLHHLAVGSGPAVRLRAQRRLGPGAEAGRETGDHPRGAVGRDPPGADRARRTWICTWTFRPRTPRS